MKGTNKPAGSFSIEYLIGLGCVGLVTYASFKALERTFEQALSSTVWLISIPI